MDSEDNGGWHTADVTMNATTQESEALAMRPARPSSSIDRSSSSVANPSRHEFVKDIPNDYATIHIDELDSVVDRVQGYTIYDVDVSVQQVLRHRLVEGNNLYRLRLRSGQLDEVSGAYVYHVSIDAGKLALVLS